jgi:hypothetical protein
MTELRLSKWRWQQIPDDLRTHIKELTMQYATDWGINMELEYIWCRITPENRFLMDLTSPDTYKLFLEVEAADESI